MTRMWYPAGSADVYTKKTWNAVRSADIQPAETGADRKNIFPAKRQGNG